MIITEFKNLAVMHFGGSHPKNVSYLNNERKGKVYLFDCSPPTFLTKPVVFDKKYLLSKEAWKEANKILNRMVNEKAGANEYTQMIFDVLLTDFFKVEEKYPGRDMKSYFEYASFNLKKSIKNTIKGYIKVKHKKEIYNSIDNELKKILSFIKEMETA